MPDNFLGFFSQEMKQSRVSPDILCRCQITNLNLALGMLNLVDPHMKGAWSGMYSQECLQSRLRPGCIHPELHAPSTFSCSCRQNMLQNICS